MAHEKTPSALLSAMEKQAAEERARIRADAQVKADAVLAAADAECARLKEEALEILSNDLYVERERLLGEAVMKVRAERLRMKRRLLSEAFRLAGEEIERRRGGDGCAAALDLLAAEARAVVGEPCDAAVNADEGAVLVTSPDGRRRVDNGLSARLRKAQTSEEHEVARRLFRATDGCR
jgi:vacuolar-type H+-ATPase subunit E/Vma4